MGCLGCQKLENNHHCVTLEDGRTVCNFCPDYQAECLEREKEAQRILGLGDQRARLKLEQMDKEGKDTTKLRAVMNRLRLAENKVNISEPRLEPAARIAEYPAAAVVPLLDATERDTQ